MSMPNQLFLIALLAFAWTRWAGLSSRQRWTLIGISALSLGAMPGINSWDVLVYAPRERAVSPQRRALPFIERSPHRR